MGEICYNFLSLSLKFFKPASVCIDHRNNSSVFARCQTSSLRPFRIRLYCYPPSLSLSVDSSYQLVYLPSVVSHCTLTFLAVLFMPSGVVCCCHIYHFIALYFLSICTRQQPNTKKQQIYIDKIISVSYTHLTLPTILRV